MRRTPLRAKPRRDPVTKEMHSDVLVRDRQCVAAYFDPEHECRNGWGQPHAPDDRDQLTVEHTKDQPRMGLRAPSDMAHLAAMCWSANVLGWASKYRRLTRLYLAFVDDVGPREAARQAIAAAGESAFAHPHVELDLQGCAECRAIARNAAARA